MKILVPLVLLLVTLGISSCGPNVVVITDGKIVYPSPTPKVQIASITEESDGDGE